MNNIAFNKIFQHIALFIFTLTFFIPSKLSAQVYLTATSGNPTGNYSTLKATFDAINTGTHQGDIIINISANTTEIASASLNASGTGSAAYTSININPSGGSAISISGNLAAPLIDLNGADNVTIDGLNTGGNSLTISNTSTSALTNTSTFRFIADASNNIIQNCIIEGSGTSTTFGTILFSTGTSTGNDDNTISNCTITAAGTNLPANAIYSAGTSTAIDNSNIAITSNNIQDYFNAGASSNGILVASNSSAWNISGNKFFQSATRTATAGNIHRAINIITASGINYSINNNIIGYANSSGTGTTTYDGAFPNRFLGIELTLGTTAASNVQGNTLNGISLSTNSGLITAPGIFCGISILAGTVNLGTTSGNTIGAATGTGSVSITSTTSLGYIAGIYATSVGTVSIQNNTVGAISTGGTAAIGYTFYGINTAGAAGNFTINNNTIGSTVSPSSIVIGTDGVTTSGICSFNGISNAATGTISITGNTIQNCSAFGTAASVYNGIRNTGGSKTLNISNNNIISGTLSGTGAFTGIANSAAVSIANMNNNIIRNIAKSAATGTFTAISNSGAVTTTININNNQLGNASGDLVTYSAANSAALTGISNSGGTASTELFISGNDIRGIVHSIQGTNAHTYIINSIASLSQNISSNTFTNLNVNTTGSITFISNNVALLSSGSQDVNSNAIVTAFNKGSAGGTIIVFTSSTAISSPGSVVNNLNNNFSNITVTGATVIAGWSNLDVGPATKTITGNIFNNWTGGTSAITGMTINGFGGTSSVSSNTITNIAGQGAITALTIGANGLANTLAISDNVINNIISSGIGGAVVGLASANPSPIVNINNNNINTLSSTAAGALATVSGISVSAGTAVNITNNNIYTLSSSGTTIPIINGISTTSTGTVSIQNNNIYGVTTTGIFSSGYTFNGIIAAGAKGNFTISGNTIGSTITPNSIAIGINGTTTTGVCTFNGISNAATGTISITDNTIQNCSAFGAAASVFNGILNSGGSGTLAISTNNIIAGTLSGTGAFTGISNSAAVNTANINSNIIRNIAKSAATGTFTAISNSGAVTTTININNNLLGNASGDLITYNAANSAALIGISNSGGASAAALSITANDFRGIVHSIQGTNAHTYIINSAATLSQNISNNTFTNLNVNTTGSVTFISNNVALLSSGSQDVNNNSIVTAFNKGSAGGTITLFTTAATSALGAVVNNLNNNFSAITVTGATVIAGWSNLDVGPATKTITGNIFNNWTGGTAAITGMTINGFGGISSVSSNTITNIAGQRAITALTIGANGLATTLAISDNIINNIISSGAGGAVIAIANANPSSEVNINNNNINALSSTAAGALATVSGISVSAGISVNITNNNIYTLSSSGTAIPIINGISATSTGTVSIQNNNIYSVTTTGIFSSGYTFNGINTAGASGNFSISGNTIGSTITPNSIAVGISGTTTTGVCTFYGINNAATGTISITDNTIQNCSVYGTAASVYTGIRNTGGLTLNISSNNIISGTLTGTGVFICISNSAAVTTANINNNIIRNISKSAATGTFTAISNSGAVTTTININNNQLGNASGDLITYSVANSSALTGISNSAGAATAALSITGNDIRGIVHTIQGSSSHTYIINAVATLSQNISNNTFTNLSVKTSGSIIFISNNVALTSSGSQNINENSVVTAFNKVTAGGTVTLFTSAANSASGAVINNTNNNFSGITVTGATTITGWSNLDIGPSTKTITGNTFNNWTGGTSAITVMTLDGFGGTSSVSSNTITNITGQNAITPLSIGANGTATTLNIANNIINTINSTGAGGAITAMTNSSPSSTINIYSNTINTISSTGAVAITGISTTSSTGNIFKNKIYDLSGNNASTTINGILVPSGATATLTIYNNIIGDLRATAANAANPINGINITSVTASSTINVYYNSIYLNSTSSGVTFGTSCIYHTASATSTTAKLDLRNNLFYNTSTPNGTGLTVTYRRSGIALDNFETTSNNNFYYAGTPAANKLIFNDGTNSDQTITDYQTRVSTRETKSVSEDLVSDSKFISTTSSSANFLHMAPNKMSPVESGAVNIPGITDDFDSAPRHGNAGYSGTGLAPDIGADEYEGVCINQWTGAISSDWNDAANWSVNIPTSASNAIIPGSLTNYPIISTGATAAANDLTIQGGASVTVSGNTLQIKGTISNSGTFTANEGSIEMIGTSAQTIPAGTFSGNAIINLTINNPGGVTLYGTLDITGILYAQNGDLNIDDNINLISSATQTALIDGLGNGDVLGNVNMQRYLASGFGYNYLSTPFQASTVDDLSDDLDLGASFSTLYRYNENETTYSGWVEYTSPVTLPLNAMQGYAVNFGAPPVSPKTIDMSGNVNNGALSITLYNNNRPYTKGFNLVGNPYPSPIDWDAATGWTKTNIDDAIYFFNATDEFKGTYSSYINEVSSDGVANSIIPSMQGMFVHVSNGAFPVTGTLGFSNGIRTNDLNPNFHKIIQKNTHPLLRLTAGFDNENAIDPTVIYFDSTSTLSFDKDMDALKLMNTVNIVPNVYSISPDSARLSINAMPYPIDSITSIPLGLHTEKNGWVTLKTPNTEQWPSDLFIYLHDAKAGIYHDFQLKPGYRVWLDANEYEDRFSLVFSKKSLRFQPNENEEFFAYSSYNTLYVYLNLPAGDKGNLIICNSIGQVVAQQEISGNGYHELNLNLSPGVYIVSLHSNENVYSKKIFITKE